MIALAAVVDTIGCAPADKSPAAFPTYDPFVRIGGAADTGPESTPGSSYALATHIGPTPTLAPLQVQLAGSTLTEDHEYTPTPDPPRPAPTARQETERYIVESGDTLGEIARLYGISLEALMQANSLGNPDVLEVGTALVIPPPQPGATGSSLKLIPDSELVYGPGAALFDTEAFIKSQGGYLAAYSDVVEEEPMSGSVIVMRVAQNYSVNPRLLLAILEYESGWVTDAAATPSDYPLGITEVLRTGLHSQLSRAADILNRGYYLWRINALSGFVLADGEAVPASPTINAGTAAVQYYSAHRHGRLGWDNAVGPEGIVATYRRLFGDPFALAIEPLIPDPLDVPGMSLPFEPGAIWYFTGGPHGGWDSGSAWAALDFGPPGDTAGCLPSSFWVTAAADGPIVRAGNGAVIQDLDNDGYEQTGWVVLYMHIDSPERVAPGTYLYAGERVGRPSCEGGLSNGTHLHIARRYNGEWISADGPQPFVLDGWVSSGNGIEYDGWLTRGDQQVWAWDGVSGENRIVR